MKTYCLEILTLIAIFLGPIVSIQLQKYLEKKREDQNRRIEIFKQLMATRGSTLSHQHVEALNRIDLEFSNNKKYKKVIESWKEYFDNLCRNTRNYNDNEYTIWVTRNEELLANLLYEMGLSLGYKFDKVLIKRNVYSPIGHANTELENEEIRKATLRLLKGRYAFPVYIVNTTEEEEQ